MRFHPSITFVFLVAAVVAVLATTPAPAGTVSLAWDPVQDDDLAGYRLYHGTSPGDYTRQEDVGLVTEHTLSGLDDCTSWYVAVKAFDAAGNESEAFSNETSGWPRPVVSSSNPASAEQGETLAVTLSGSNFQDGASVQFANAGITVNSVTVNACGELVANISIDQSAPTGPTDVDVDNPDGVYGTGTDLFTVQSGSAPQITDVRTENVGSTTATVLWTTDEPSDSRVFYRELGNTAYQETDLNTELVVSHSVDLFGLSPDTTYEYHVQSTDDAGQTSTSSPDQTFVTVTNGFTYIEFEAESGDLVAPVARVVGSGAFAGEWIEAGSDGSSQNPAGTATHGFHVPTAGTWHLWVRMYAPGSGSDSWYESVDGSSRQVLTVPETGSWIWVEGGAYTLGGGLHSLELGGREAETRADRILLTDDPGFVPSEVPGSDVTAPQPVTAFDATPGASMNQLTWTNPSNGDLAEVVIRYRTDGSYPTSPADGFPVTTEAATPNASDSYDHTGLSDDVTYYYSAFAVDETGNASDPATTSASPLDVTPPAPVNNLRRTDQRSD